jgi:hypothetical protein
MMLDDDGNDAKGERTGVVAVATRVFLTTAKKGHV